MGCDTILEDYTPPEVYTGLVSCCRGCCDKFTWEEGLTKVSLFHAEGAEKMLSRRLLWRGQGGPSGVVQQLWHPGLQRWTVSVFPAQMYTSALPTPQVFTAPVYQKLF